VQLDPLDNGRASDHLSFRKLGYRAVDVHDSYNPHHHCEDGQDSFETLNMQLATDVLRSSAAVVAEALEDPQLPPQRYASGERAVAFCALQLRVLRNTMCSPNRNRR